MEIQKNKHTRARKALKLAVGAAMLCLPMKTLQAQQKNSVKNARDKPEKKYRTALGIEYIWPFYSLSLKHTITDHSVLEAVVSPFSASNGLSFYGARYIYRFNINEFSNDVAGYPYLFAGLGLMRWHYNDYYLNYSGSAPSYYFGAGYELILTQHFAISAEAGYGELSALGDDAIFAFTYGGGFHYYFSRSNNRKH